MDKCLLYRIESLKQILLQMGCLSEVINKDLIKKYNQLMLPEFNELRAIFNMKSFNYRMMIKNGVVEFNPNSSKSKSFDEIESILKSFIPWKKGPWRFDEIFIDSEWRSDWKWKRILPFVGNIEGQVVADIGCNNGYYLYQINELNPELVIGFEPVLKYFCQFEFFQKLNFKKNIHLLPLGIQHFQYFEKKFNLVFCLGILYHHPNPIALLQYIWSSLKPGGRIIFDVQGINGSEPNALLPRKKYSGAKGFWYLPTQSCLENMLLKSGFQNIDIFYNQRLEYAEQRSTDWMPFSSLKQGLNTLNRTQTIEGYPAPVRIYGMAER